MDDESKLEMCTLNCRHEFHVYCLAKWWGQTKNHICPLCRQKHTFKRPWWWKVFCVMWLLFKFGVFLLFLSIIFFIAVAIYVHYFYL